MDCVLIASGSKGNCIYVGNGSDSIVVDAGVGYLKRTLEEHGLPIGIIRALCITHEHSDHCQSAKAFLKALQIPVAGSGGTLSVLRETDQFPTGTDCIMFHAGDPHMIGGLEVTSFRTYHDAAEPTGFIIDDGEARVGICLDTHKVSDAMTAVFKSCDAVVLESNYSETAMKTDRFPTCSVCRECGANCGGNCQVFHTYPQYLKDRIREDGHLSNECSAETIGILKNDVGIIALAHLSENYNRPNIARMSSEEALGDSDCRLFVSDQLPLYREKRMVRFSV
ncbi:MAG TPA: MBL fold metallo-hydrolase [Methanocorpusculum sp.]|nr:MBL fold metallo-hydrolase [Methanocorpusculum sp.]